MYNLVPRAFPLKNGKALGKAKSPGDEGDCVQRFDCVTFSFSYRKMRLLWVISLISAWLFFLVTARGFAVHFVHRQELIEEIDGVRDDPAMDSDAKSRFRNQNCRKKGERCWSIFQCCSHWCTPTNFTCT